MPVVLGLMEVVMEVGVAAGLLEWVLEKEAKVVGLVARLLETVMVVELVMEKEAKAMGVVVEKEVEVVGMMEVVMEMEMEGVGMVVGVVVEMEVEVVGMVVEMEVEVVGMVVVEVVEAGTSWKYLYNFHRNIMKVVDIYYHKTHNLMDQTKNPMSSNKAYYNK
jgi:DNA polymerase/3'-5' exonuclease PolX